MGDVIAPDRSELDLARPTSIVSAIRRYAPTLIVNAGAYTAVDRAESEASLCFAVNAEAPRVLAEEAHRIGCVLIHFSTDYVFDGAKRSPYVETDPTGPLNVYGASKLEGERLLVGATSACLIFRLSWVFSPHGSNFFRSMLRLSRERQTLSVVNDQTGAPTCSGPIAAAIASIIRRLKGEGDVRSSAMAAAGIYHLSAAGSTTWYGFARSIIASDPQKYEQTCVSIEPVESCAYHTAAERPRYSVLDNRKIAECFGISLPHWRSQLDGVVSEMRRLEHRTAPVTGLWTTRAAE